MPFTTSLTCSHGSCSLGWMGGWVGGDVYFFWCYTLHSSATWSDVHADITPTSSSVHIWVMKTSRRQAFLAGTQMFDRQCKSIKYFLPGHAKRAWMVETSDLWEKPGQFLGKESATWWKDNESTKNQRKWAREKTQSSRKEDKNALAYETCERLNTGFSQNA